MSDGNENKAIGNRSELPPPRFDEHAHLRAQPVKPIPKSRVMAVFEKLFADGSRSLALIVTLGVLTGALIGMALVGQNTSAPEANDQALALPHDNRLLQLENAEVGVDGIQTDPTSIRPAASRRPRVPNNGQPRAYRFGVIR